VAPISGPSVAAAAAATREGTFEPETSAVRTVHSGGRSIAGILAALAQTTGAAAAVAFRVADQAAGEIALAEPADTEVSSEVHAMVARLVAAAHQGDTITSARVEHAVGGATCTWKPYLLRTPGEARVVGAVALALSHEPDAAPSNLLARLADALVRGT
jgi:hypothetical protein